ncbi:MAG TPA: DnaJ domain-containing protein [Thermoanaerobaculia bacterium]
MIAIFFILIAGGGLAAFVIGAMTMLTREQERSEVTMPAPQRDTIAASLLFHVVAAGGGGEEDALRQVRRGSGIAAPVTRGIDAGNWAESYARIATPQQRRELLEVAVQLVAARSPVPVRQYAALLDLSFGLGFQTDALARLRELYGFEYVDHARDGRPRGADREPLFARKPQATADLLRVLGLEATPTREELSAAYRRLVSQHHPDRFHGATSEAQSEASARFIEITRAYEELLRTFV